MSEWIPLKDIEITDEIKKIHCDTRDFHVLLLNEEPDFTLDPHDIHDFSYLNRGIEKGLKDDYLIEPNQIKSFLTNLFEMSGGVATWRFLSFKSMNPNNDPWLKYVRFYRYPKDKTKFIVCDQYNKPLPYKRCVKSNLKTDYLNTH